MRALVINLALITAIIITPVLINVVLNENVSSSNDNVLRIRYSIDYDNLDYLFVGSSHTYSSVDPKLFDSIGVKTYNLGVASAGALFYELLINDYLNNTATTPKNIVLSVTPYTFSNKSDNFSIYPIHEYLNTKVTNEELLSKTHDFKTYFNNLFEKVKKVNLYHRNSILLANSANLENKINEVRTNKGHIPSEVLFTRERYNAELHLYEPMLESKFPQEKFKLLLALIDDLKNRGVHVIVHEEPTFRLKEFLSEEYMDRYEAAFDVIASMNIQILRCKLPFDSTYFRNIDHMNSKGAVAYTHFLIKELNLN